VESQGDLCKCLTWWHWKGTWHWTQSLTYFFWKQTVGEVEYEIVVCVLLINKNQILIVLCIIHKLTQARKDEKMEGFGVESQNYHKILNLRDIFLWGFHMWCFMDYLIIYVRIKVAYIILYTIRLRFWCILRCEWWSNSITFCEVVVCNIKWTLCNI
jgi:hypothetical protein